MEGAARWNNLSASRLSVSQQITRQNIDPCSSSDGGRSRHRDNMTPSSQPLECATLNRMELPLIWSWRSWRGAVFAPFCCSNFSSADFILGGSLCRTTIVSEDERWPRVGGCCGEARMQGVVGGWSILWPRSDSGGPIVYKL